MTYRVEISEHARRQLLEIDDWWRINRSGPPDLVSQEFARAVAVLEAAPAAGKPYARIVAQGYRRLLLPRPRLHLYYLIDEATRVVFVAALWSARRGHGPELR